MDDAVILLPRAARQPSPSGSPSGSIAAVRGVSISVVIVMVVSLGAAGVVSGSADGPGAVASKSKCKKKSRWKCAPKRYHLSASGTFSSLTYSEVWSAEVDLGKRRASPGTVDYAQDGGQVTVSGSGTYTYTPDACLGTPGASSGNATLSVPQQTLQVPRGGINDADFGLTFKLKLFPSGIGKNEYALGVGAVQPELSNIKGTATVTCPDGSAHTVAYSYINTIQTTTVLVERAKVGNSPLRGSAQGAGNSVTWKLTKSK